MTSAAQQVLASLDRLEPTEREEVVVEILRRVSGAEHTTPDDQEVVELAEGIFLDLDELEATG